MIGAVTTSLSGGRPSHTGDQPEQRPRLAATCDGQAGDLPQTLSAVHSRHHVPHHAEIGLAVVAAVLVVTTDLRGVIGFSSFGVPVY